MRNAEKKRAEEVEHEARQWREFCANLRRAQRQGKLVIGQSSNASAGPAPAMPRINWQEDGRMIQDVIGEPRHDRSIQRVLGQPEHHRPIQRVMQEGVPAVPNSSDPKYFRKDHNGLLPLID